MTRIYLRGTDLVGLSHYEERMDRFRSNAEPLSCMHYSKTSHRIVNKKSEEVHTKSLVVSGYCLLVSGHDCTK